LHVSEPELDPKYVVNASWLPGGDDYDIHERPANLRQGDQPQNVEPTETEEPCNPVKHQCSFRREGPAQYTLVRKLFDTRDVEMSASRD